MSTQAIAGFAGFLFVDTVKVAEIREATISIDHEAIDSTTHDDAPWRSNIAGLRGFTISADYLYVSGATGQESILARILDGATVAFILQPETGTGKREFTGTARITSWEQALPNDDADAVSIEMLGVGALVDAVQA